MSKHPPKEDPHQPAGPHPAVSISGGNFEEFTAVQGSGIQIILPGGSSAEFPRPDTWRAVRDASALALGVHRARAIGGAVDESMPPYVTRDFDDELRLRLRQAAVDGGMILLTGDSTAGKTRAAFEAMRAELPGHRIFAPPHGADLRRLPDTLARRPGRYLLWLDDLEGYLGRDGLTADLLSALLRFRVTVLATLRDGLREAYWPQAERRAAASGDLEAQRAAHSGAGLLNMAELVEVPRIWSARELERASWEDDPRLIEATQRHGEHGISEYLAAGPELWLEWRQAIRAGGHPRGAALVAAAVDLTRTGLSAPFPRQLLEEVHEQYVAAAGGRRLRPEPLAEAWEWAMAVRFGATSLLVPGGRDGEWQAFDYLIDAAIRDKRLQIPEATWNAAVAWARQARDEREQYNLGWDAMMRGPLQAAAAAFEPLALAGDAEAANNMGVISERKLAAGLKSGFFSLVLKAMSGKIDIDKALDFATSMSFERMAAEPISALAGMGVLDTGNSPELAEAERWYRLAYEGGYHEAAKSVAELLKQTGRRAEAITWYEKAVHAAVPGAAHDLGQLHEDLGNPGEAERWYRHAAPVASPLSQGVRAELRQGGASSSGRTSGGADPSHVLKRRTRALADGVVDTAKDLLDHFKGMEADTARQGPAAVTDDPPRALSYGRPAWRHADRRVLYGHLGPATSVCPVPGPSGGAVLVSGGLDGTLRLWNPLSGEPVGGPLTGRSGITALCPVPLSDGSTALASGDEDGRLWLWDIQERRLIRGPIQAHEQRATALCTIAVPRAGVLLASGGADSRLLLWDLGPGRPSSIELRAGTQPIQGLCSLRLPNGNSVIASAAGPAEHDGHDSKLQLWAADDDLPLGEPFGTSAGHVRTLAAVPGEDGSEILLTGSSDGAVRLWDPAAGEQIMPPLTGDTGWIGALCPLPLPGGPVLAAAGGKEGTIRLWDPRAGQLAGELLRAGDCRQVRSLCTVPLDEQRFAIAAAGGSWSPEGGAWCVQIWYPESGTEKAAGNTGRAARALHRDASGQEQAPPPRPVIEVRTDKADAIRAFTLATDLVEAGRLTEAAAQYREGAAAGHAPSVNGLAMVTHGRGDLDEAERLYRLAARAFLPQAQLNLGDLLRQRGKRAEAARHYREFAAVMPFGDSDHIVSFLLDEHSIAARPLAGLHVDLDQDRLPSPDVDLDDLELNVALSLIFQLRTWRQAHDPARLLEPGAAGSGG